MEKQAMALAARAALGEEMTVRLGGNRSVTGTIKSVTFNRIKQLRNGDRQAIFDLTLVSGTAQVERVFTVAGFPGRS